MRKRVARHAQRRILHVDGVITPGGLSQALDATAELVAENHGEPDAQMWHGFRELETGSDRMV